MDKIADEIEPAAWNSETVRRQVFDLVRQTPRGVAISYGAIGARCEPPISGYIVGRILSQVPSDVPWWRVVGKDGALPIRKRHPHLAVEQKRLLEDEGARFDEEGRAFMRESST